jgi:hypothetical protein
MFTVKFQVGTEPEEKTIELNFKSKAVALDIKVQLQAQKIDSIVSMNKIVG